MGLAYIHYSNCITYNIWQDHFFLNPNFNAFLWFNTSEFDPDSVVKGGKNSTVRNTAFHREQYGNKNIKSFENMQKEIEREIFVIKPEV